MLTLNSGPLCKSIIEQQCRHFVVGDDIVVDVYLAFITHCDSRQIVVIECVAADSIA